MIPILRADQIRALDKQTIEQEPIASIDLMERAAEALLKVFLSKFNKSKVLVICGPGNNGGDGLAIARMLIEKEWEIQVICPIHDKVSEDFARNRSRLQQMGCELKGLREFDHIRSFDLIIDAVFGTGLDRKIEGEYLNLIHWVNTQNAYVVSIDMPSGMPDRPLWDLQDCCVISDLLLTLAYPKLSFLLPYADGYVQEWELIDIGLIEFKGQTIYYLTESSDLEKSALKNERFTHKYKRGKVLLCGGSKGMTGSIVLSAEAAFRTGSGLVDCLIPSCAKSALQSYLPEAMYSLSGEEILESFPTDLKKCSAIGIGPGMGRDPRLKTLIQQALRTKLPQVIDADALQLIAEHNLQDQLPIQCVITPHEGEFKALVGSWTDDNDKLNRLMAFCKKHQLICVLKGAYTIVCDGKRCYFNSSGHPAMSTAGSGDVLMGVICSLLGKGLAPLDAAKAGVYLHGLSAEIYLQQNRSSSLLAQDIAKGMGLAITEVLG